MKPEILAKLGEAEKENNAKILYAVESGSRAWGFASEDSDWDVRFIYKKPLKEYLSVQKQRDVIELPIENDLDINGWDLIKAVKLLGKSNPPLIEWLFSPVKYVENGSLAENMRRYVSDHCSYRASVHHYLHMASGNYKKYIKSRKDVLRKKYLYVLRPLICVEWIRANKTPPPVRFMDVVQGVGLDADVKRAVKRIFSEKISGEELGIGPHDCVLDSYIDSAFDDFNEWARNSPEKKPDYARLDKIIFEELF